ncbi:MAG: Nif3-like dinuclear metal center hexameric protein [Deltaproteobacteria bacterium]|nr:MAG: Nif3-like dinuclear metal center hexameric protein [Deltaproteobacteria bacterium]
MAELKDIISLIEEIAPLELAEKWDNSGLQIGCLSSKIKKVAFALDPDFIHLKTCSEKNIDLLVTHHPFFFSNIKSIDLGSSSGRCIETAIKSDIAVYSAHTTLDSAKQGLNDYFIEKIGLKAIRPITNSPLNDEITGLGRIALNSENFTAKDLAVMIKKKLELETLRIVGDKDLISSHIGVCTGSGISLMKEAFLLGARIFITGDLKYHDAKDAVDLGICVIDAGHFGTEYISSALLKERLDKLLKLKGYEVSTEILKEKDVFETL